MNLHPRTVAWLAAASVWLVAAGCGSTGHFRDVNFDPYYQLTGERAVADQHAARTDCYRVSRLGDETRIRYERSGTPADRDPRFGVAELIAAKRDGARLVRFTNLRGAPEPSGGVHAIELRVNDAERVVSRINRNHLGYPVAGARGVAMYRFGHDAAGRIAQIAFFDRAEQPTRDADGVASYALEYDARGRLQRLTHRGPDGKPAPDRHGVALRWWEYDEAGRVASASTHGANQLLVDDARTGYAQTRFDYDEEGREIERRFVAANGDPALDHRGVHAARRWYDEHGNPVMESFHDRQMQPAPRADSGVARVTFTRDDRGRVVREQYAGPEGQPVADTTTGLAEVRRHYDERGRLTRQEYFDIHGQRAAHAVSAIAAIGWKYDEHGLVTEEFYLDRSEMPVDRADTGVGVLRFRYNKLGYRTETVTWGANGLRKPWRGMGFVRTVIEYDDHGNMLTRRLLGLGDRPVNHPVYGHAVVQYRYDAQGYLTATEYLDTAGNLIRRK